MINSSVKHNQRLLNNRWSFFIHSTVPPASSDDDDIFFFLRWAQARILPFCEFWQFWRFDGFWILTFWIVVGWNSRFWWFKRFRWDFARRIVCWWLNFEFWNQGRKMFQTWNFIVVIISSARFSIRLRFGSFSSSLFESFLLLLLLLLLFSFWQVGSSCSSIFTSLIFSRWFSFSSSLNWRSSSGGSGVDFKPTGSFGGAKLVLLILPKTRKG